MLLLLLLFTSISDAAPICSNLLWETWADCGNNVAPGANGCCANGQCPPGCMYTGSSCCPQVCTCTGCPFARKPLLMALSIQDQWVGAHNFYRCRHGQNPVTWSSQVGGNAQTWANKCTVAHSGALNNNPPSGENIAQGFANLFGTIDFWYSEINNYTPQPSGQGLCSATCGHYTAVIWASTTVIGCGSCASIDFDVCQYALGPPNYNMDTESVANIPRTNTPVNDDATCCARAFGGGTPTPAPTPASACAVETTVWGTWPSTQPGASTSMGCPPGYTGTVRRSCGSNGVWQDVDSSGCVAVIPSCAAENGWPITAPDTTASRACPAGAVGSDTRQCNAAGAWALEVNTCVVPATCTDGIQNQGEQGIDCGCTTCTPPCPACLVCGTINCGAHGSCVEPNPVCICKDGYTGSRCDVPPVDPCANVNCGSHGACSGGSCSCFTGYTGPTCATALTPTCTDGVQNSDEAGIDCGGVVAQCFTCPNYQWLPNAWTSCSKPCGGGSQTRTVSCMSTVTSQAVSATFCGNNPHPFTTSQPCNVDACPTYTWQAGTWGPCSTACNGGVQSRSVDCYSSAGNVIVQTGCDVSLKPGTQQPCNTPVCTIPRWVSADWSVCTATCGGGSQMRTVQCQDQDNKVIDDSTCTPADKPSLQQACNLQSCDTYRWKACPTFYPCTAQCNGGGAMAGIQYRDVFCVRNSDSFSVDASLCNNQTQPTSALSICNTQPCSGYNWMADGNWGPCTQQPNGVYLRTRTFHCHAADGTTVLRQNCVDKAGKLPIAAIPCTAGTCANADGCPTIEIAEVLNFCDSNAIETCTPGSDCYQAASDVDLSLSSVGVSATTAVQCFNDYVASLAVAQRPSASVLQTIADRLQAGQKVCGVGINGASSLGPVVLVYLCWLFL